MDSAHVTMMLLDGTVIDDEDYFQTLPAQTLIMFRLDGEPFKTGILLIGYSLLNFITHCSFNHLSNWCHVYFHIDYILIIFFFIVYWKCI